jgi:hypothetical protein
MIDAGKGEGYDFVSTFGREDLDELQGRTELNQRFKKYDLAAKRGAGCLTD